MVLEVAAQLALVEGVAPAHRCEADAVGIGSTEVVGAGCYAPVVGPAHAGLELLRPRCGVAWVVLTQASLLAAFHL